MKRKVGKGKYRHGVVKGSIGRGAQREVNWDGGCVERFCIEKWMGGHWSQSE